MNNYEFWSTHGKDNIIPKGFGEFPEGWDVKGLVREIADEIGYNSVIDFGCGYGRLCESFSHEKYLGIDINHDLLEEAKKRFSNYRFEPLKEGGHRADLCFAYTVFLHMTDKELHEALRNIRCKYLIVAEILGREWRRDGLPPVYNRDLTDYVQMLRAHDLVLHKHVKRPYERYSNSWYKEQKKNTDISFLVFRKCFKNPMHA